MAGATVAAEGSGLAWGSWGTGVLGWDHSVQVGNEALVGMMGCQETARAEKCWAGWFCPCG